ncbi:MAG: glycyl-radical enzyme activating protein [Lachnospiraceae bacterium]|nr:glycyl-radical enzyme activating protein [Lachnospiraceae bacterium]
MVFLKGCTLRCRWCCNPEAMLPELVLMFNPALCIGCGACLAVCPVHASGTVDKIVVDRTRCTGCGACAEVCFAEAKYRMEREMEAEELMEEIRKDRTFYGRTHGGVTFSGGEALLQPAFLGEMLTLCRKEGIGTAVETCENVPWENFERTLFGMDEYLYDIKHTDSARHREYTGSGCERIMENCRKLISCGKRVVVRTPVIPEFNFDRQSLAGILRFAEEAGAEEVNFLPYHRYAANKYLYLGREYWNPGINKLERAQVEECLSGIKTTIRFRVDG